MLARLLSFLGVRREAAPEPIAPPAPQPAIRVLPIGEGPATAPAGLTPRDLARLEGVHPDLVRVVQRARATAPFFVAEGLRTPKRQAELMRAGKSTTLASRHITGHAVDLYPITDTPIPQMTKADFAGVVIAMRKAAAAEGVPVTWGGDWATFVDAPHWELPRGSYPG